MKNIKEQEDDWIEITRGSLRMDHDVIDCKQDKHALKSPLLILTHSLCH